MTRWQDELNYGEDIISKRLDEMTTHQCKCGGSYDEHDLCFECNAPRPQTPAERQRARRAKKAGQGLVKVEVWVKREHQEKLKDIAKAMV